MERNELIALHTRGLEEYSAFWRGPELREKAGMSENEAAFHLLQHLGMLYRYTAEPEVLRPFLERSPEERRALVSSACEYAVHTAWAEELRVVAESEDVDSETLDRFGRLVQRRDVLDVAVGTSRSLTRDFIDTDRDLRESLAEVILLEHELDGTFLEVPEALAIAVEGVQQLQEHVRIPINTNRQWWFRSADSFAARLEDEFIVALERATAGTQALPSRSILERIGPFVESLLGRAVDLAKGLVPEPHECGWDDAVLQFCSGDETSGEAFSLTLALEGVPEVVVLLTVAVSEEKLRVALAPKADRAAPSWLEGGCIALEAYGRILAQGTIQDGVAFVPIPEETPDTVVAMDSSGTRRAKVCAPFQ